MKEQETVAKKMMLLIGNCFFLFPELWKDQTDPEKICAVSKNVFATFLGTNEKVMKENCKTAFKKFYIIVLKEQFKENCFRNIENSRWQQWWYTVGLFIFISTRHNWYKTICFQKNASYS